MPQELRKTARERKLAIDLIEKDYALGWILYGISRSTVAKHLAFKDGTALSKVYFPGTWRLSEDLDFTVVDDADMKALGSALASEVPEIVARTGGLSVELKKVPFANPKYLQSRFSYAGPISRNNIKIEVSREPFIGEVVSKAVPKAFDYPEFAVQVYSLDNLVAEKMRALIERGKIRDYYDVWKLLRTAEFDKEAARDLFMKKCESKGVAFTGLEQIFPDNLAKKLDPFLETWLIRLSPEPLPELETIIAELKASLKDLLG